MPPKYFWKILKTRSTKKMNNNQPLRSSAVEQNISSIGNQSVDKSNMTSELDGNRHNKIAEKAVVTDNVQLARNGRSVFRRVKSRFARLWCRFFRRNTNADNRQTVHKSNVKTAQNHKTIAIRVNEVSVEVQKQQLVQKQ